MAWQELPPSPRGYPASAPDKQGPGSRSFTGGHEVGSTSGRLAHIPLLEPAGASGGERGGSPTARQSSSSSPPRGSLASFRERVNADAELAAEDWPLNRHSMAAKSLRGSLLRGPRAPPSLGGEPGLSGGGGGDASEAAGSYRVSSQRRLPSYAYAMEEGGGGLGLPRAASGRAYDAEHDGALPSFPGGSFGERLLSSSRADTSVGRGGALLSPPSSLPSRDYRAAEPYAYASSPASGRQGEPYAYASSPASGRQGEPYAYASNPRSLPVGGSFAPPLSSLPPVDAHFVSGPHASSSSVDGLALTAGTPPLLRVASPLPRAPSSAEEALPLQSAPLSAFLRAPSARLLANGQGSLPFPPAGALLASSLASPRVSAAAALLWPTPPPAAPESSAPKLPTPPISEGGGAFSPYASDVARSKGGEAADGASSGAAPGAPPSVGEAEAALRGSLAPEVGEDEAGASGLDPPYVVAGEAAEDDVNAMSPDRHSSSADSLWDFQKHTAADDVLTRSPTSGHPTSAEGGAQGEAADGTRGRGFGSVELLSQGRGAVSSGGAASPGVAAAAPGRGSNVEQLEATIAGAIAAAAPSARQAGGGLAADGLTVGAPPRPSDIPRILLNLQASQWPPALESAADADLEDASHFSSSVSTPAAGQSRAPTGAGPHASAAGGGITRGSAETIKDLQRAFTPPVIPPSRMSESTFRGALNAPALARGGGAAASSVLGADTSAAAMAPLRESRSGGLGESDEQLDLMYDPILNAYYDPKTNRYFELI